MDFDPGQGVLNLNSNGLQDAFLQKLDSNGNLAWAKSFGGINYDAAQALVSDHNGNVYVVGSYSLTVDFDPNLGVVNSTANGGKDIFIQKLDSSGNFIWTKSIGGIANDEAFDIEITNSNKLIITGWFSNSVDFDPGANQFIITSFIRSNDAFILSLDLNGDFLWAKSLYGLGGTKGNEIVIDDFGNSYLTGFYSANTDFDPGPNVHNIQAVNLIDAFVLKLDSLGSFEWVHTFGGNSDDLGLSIALDVNNGVYVCGYFYGVVDFDPSQSVFNLTGGIPYSSYIFKLNQNNSVRIEKQEFENEISVYPIPAHDKINISLKRQFTNIAITVRDINGRIIGRYNKYQSQQFTIQLNGNAGLYLSLIHI